jgi:hypothetical protein
VKGHNVGRRIFYGLPSKLGMSDGNFVEITSQGGLCLMGLFVKWNKYGKFKVAKNGNQFLENIF